MEVQRDHRRYRDERFLQKVAGESPSREISTLADIIPCAPRLRQLHPRPHREPKLAVWLYFVAAAGSQCGAGYFAGGEFDGLAEAGGFHAGHELFRVGVEDRLLPCAESSAEDEPGQAGV
jgi:hypothetical protein